MADQQHDYRQQESWHRSQRRMMPKIQGVDVVRRDECNESQDRARNEKHPL